MTKRPTEQNRQVVVGDDARRIKFPKSSIRPMNGARLSQPQKATNWLARLNLRRAAVCSDLSAAGTALGQPRSVHRQTPYSFFESRFPLAPDSQTSTILRRPRICNTQHAIRKYPTRSHSADGFEALSAPRLCVISCHVQTSGPVRPCPKRTRPHF